MPPVIALLLATSLVGPTTHANGTTLPFQRHVVRVGDPAAGAGRLFAAIQQQGANGEGLVLYASDDQGESWRRERAIQPDASVRDTADLLADPDGAGFSALYSLEPASSLFAADSRADVVYLHYRVGADGSAVLDTGPIVVFRPGTNQGWFRASLTRDAAGVLHAAATLRDGSRYRFLTRLSIDGGRQWTEPEELASFTSSFGGGRVTAFGSQIAAIYDEYAWGTNGRYRLRRAGACETWGREELLNGDGLYHAGAFSVLATPDGRLHLGYSNKRTETLRYTEFRGDGWSAPITLESTGLWSNQPALSFVGGALVYSWNHPDTPDSMRIFQRRRVDGSWGQTRVLDSVPVFKGYTNAAESVPAGEKLPVLWSQAGTSPATVRCAPIAP